MPVINIMKTITMAPAIRIMIWIILHASTGFIMPVPGEPITIPISTTGLWALVHSTVADGTIHMGAGAT